MHQLKIEIFGDILTKGFSTIMGPVLVTQDTTLVATSTGVKDLVISNIIEVVVKTLFTGTSSYTGDNNPVITGTDSLEVIQIVSKQNQNNGDNSYCILSN